MAEKTPLLHSWFLLFACICSKLNRFLILSLIFWAFTGKPSKRFSAAFWYLNSSPLSRMSHFPDVAIGQVSLAELPRLFHFGVAGGTRCAKTTQTNWGKKRKTKKSYEALLLMMHKLCEDNFCEQQVAGVFVSQGPRVPGSCSFGSFIGKTTPNNASG